ncbi:DUF1464 family protein [Dictyobacter kobayashii]|uniref:DUF1464 domain-containing protein n=1 Tax=Dictyobacter kobayashii TaxID=2014872 RepID=A0A402ABE8_9CHLR|nr:DUF1464 family protein [Dictyobacter kobayashii]GCE16405.1 hypothetical protein KDK_02050 [Dictyobacter kobayashii]
MAIYIGIDYTDTGAKICLTEDDALLEWRHFQDPIALQTYLQRACASYLVVSIAVAIPGETELVSLDNRPVDQWKIAPAYKDFLSLLPSLSPQSYILPSIRYLPTIAAHRRLLRADFGSSATLCRIASLLYQMRKQDAPWSELTFHHLELLNNAYRLAVIKNGQLIDGVGEWRVFSEAGEVEENSQAREELVSQALFEQLTRELAAMLAIHHSEDIVVLEHTQQPAASRKEMIIEYFADHYQFFHYPQSETELIGFEAAQGAAILAHGLSRPGLAAEVVQQLFAMAHAECFNDQREH